MTDFPYKVAVVYEGGSFVMLGEQLEWCHQRLGYGVTQGVLPISKIAAWSFDMVVDPDLKECGGLFSFQDESIAVEFKLRFA